MLGEPSERVALNISLLQVAALLNRLFQKVLTHTVRPDHVGGIPSMWFIDKPGYVNSVS